MDKHSELNPTRSRAPSWRGAAYFRRSLLLLQVLTQMVVGTYYMVAILPYHGETLLEQALIASFAILFGWIDTGFWTAVLGFVLRRGGDRHSLLRRHAAADLNAAPAARTAVVMPLYHDPVERSHAGLCAVYLSLLRTGHLDQFVFYILSVCRVPE